MRRQIIVIQLARNDTYHLFLAQTVQFGWPLGMPLVDHIEGDIWEVRIKLVNNQLALPTKN